MKRILLVGLLSSYVQGYEYPKPINGYFSQKGQDKFLNEEIFKFKQSGLFVEVGAHDGISFSNSYYFEKCLGWSGICIEPNIDMFDKLTHNRIALCLPFGIAKANGKRFFLKCTGYMLEMYSGILDTYDERHLERIKNEQLQFGGENEVVTIDCRTLENIFDEYKITHINILSIDIEGGEQEAIESINFDKVTIDTIVIENNFNESSIRDYLLQKNYDFITRLGKDDIFISKRINV